MLRLEGLAKTYPTGTKALAGLSLDIGAAEIVAVVGGSGCGKSTLLRLVAGLDRPSAGRVLVDGEPISAPHPSVGIVFQEARLLPWRSVAQNIAFGIAHLPREEREARVTTALARIGLAEHARRWPRELSGGQAQRVALARALVARPRVLLLDEPFSALDAFTRADLQEHLLALWADTRPTLLLVTHDIEEALVLADRVVVMQPHPGRIATVRAVDLPRPRAPGTPAFDALKRDILDVLGPTRRIMSTAAE
ncbi:ABC transporter ATP-binding protein [Ancylobacter sp. Lp-2]|uniref:ABC transporter ATP-binding protein n=1 Tax=Ancylobacter sp. Lp-2 TaxID=2881339 RepID=UPI001E289890|nr:ABC transporter ATP-binding protein [Ancylobacter sp. Lp-2]MCB4769691.1 ABC transporter ATP-binding protein [Ancylobacter sp. Lp-2]